jgi:hypothetical protein
LSGRSASKKRCVAWPVAAPEATGEGAHTEAAQGTAADGDELSVSRYCRFIIGEETFCTQWEIKLTGQYILTEITTPRHQHCCYVD